MNEHCFSYSNSHQNQEAIWQENLNRKMLGDKCEATEKVHDFINSASFFEKSKKDALFSCKMEGLHKSEGLDA
jgi:hypothetical protein